MARDLDPHPKPPEPKPCALTAAPPQPPAAAPPGPAVSRRGRLLRRADSFAKRRED